MASYKKDMTKILAKLREQGWQGADGVTRRSHYRLVPPDRRYPVIYQGGTPSDYRGLKNFIAHLKRCGADLDDA